MLITEKVYLRGSMNYNFIYLLTNCIRKRSENNEQETAQKLF